MTNVLLHKLVTRYVTILSSTYNDICLTDAIIVYGINYLRW